MSQALTVALEGVMAREIDARLNSVIIVVDGSILKICLMVCDGTGDDFVDSKVSKPHCRGLIYLHFTQYSRIRLFIFDIVLLCLIVLLSRTLTFPKWTLKSHAKISVPPKGLTAF